MNAFRLFLLSLVVSYSISSAQSAELELVRGVAAQPLKAQVTRVVEALSYLGEPLTTAQQTQLDAAIKEMDEAKATAAVQAVLDPLCLAGVNMGPRSLSENPGHVV